MSTLAEDLAADFLLVDGLESIRYERMDEGGIVTKSGIIPKALRRAAQKSMFVMPGFDNQPDRLLAITEVVIWHIPVTSLTPITPMKGDVVIDDATNTRWIVWMIETQTFRTRYRLTCIKE